MQKNTAPLRIILCGLTCFLWIADAHAIRIQALQDTWIRESAPDDDYNDDLISVWDGTTTDQRRHGVVLFDLTDTIGLTINSVFLELFDADDSGGSERSETFPIDQEAYILSQAPPLPTGITDPYTWNEYVGFDQPNEQLLDSLGHYDIPAGDTINGYEFSDFASPADITLLQQARNGNSDNVVAFVLKAASGERDWGDIEAAGRPPRLVLNESYPVIGDFTGDGMVTIADYNVMIDPLNWLQTVELGTRGDVTQDGFVGLADFGTFKPIFLAANPGSGASLTIPEPATGALGALVFVALMGRIGRTRRQWADARRARLRWRGTVRLAQITMLACCPLWMPSMVAAVTVTESYDAWIRDEGLTLGDRDGDWLGVYNATAGGSLPRWSVLEFDLSGLAPLTVNDVQLGFWHMFPGSPVGSSDPDPSSQTVALITENGATTAMPDFTWQQLNDPGQVTLTEFETLGAIDLQGLVANPDEADKYHYGAGSAADRALIQAAVDAGSTLRIVARSDESVLSNLRVDWGDGANDGDASHGMSTILLINEAPPEIVELTLEINAGSGAMAIVNPGVDPAENTMFDLDGYLIQSPGETLNPGGFTGLSGAGQSGWQIVAPTIGAITELALDASTLFAEGNRIGLGTGYLPGAAEDDGLTFEYNLVGAQQPILGNVQFVTGSLPGDYDGNGTLSPEDFTIFRDNLGTGFQLLNEGEGVTPGQVTSEDFDFWKNSFFNAGRGRATATAIPEPATWLMGCLAAPALAVWRRRKLTRLRT